MKKSSFKALLITGLIVECGNPLFIIVIALLFPRMPKEFSMPIIGFFECLGVVLLTLATARKRLDNGSIAAKNVFTALTPAQICLISSVIFIFAGTTASAFGSTNAGGMLVGAGIIGTACSIILAIIRSVILRRKRKEKQANIKPVHTDPQSAPPPVVQPKPEKSNESGKTVSDGAAHAAPAKREPSETRPEPAAAYQHTDRTADKARCCVCGYRFELRKLILVDDQYYCGGCFRSHFNDPGSDVDPENL